MFGASVTKNLALFVSGIITEHRNNYSDGTDGKTLYCYLLLDLFTSNVNIVRAGAKSFTAIAQAQIYLCFLTMSSL